MAKTSKIYRERQRKETVAKYAERRAEYKRALVRQQLLIHLMSFSPETVTLEALQ